MNCLERRESAMIFAGIDCGGTKTKCVLCDEKGSILGTGISGPSNGNYVETSVGQESITNAVIAAISDSNIPINAIHVLGIGTLCNENAIHNAVASLREKVAINRLLVIERDSRIALAGATVCGHGIVVIGGTGSVAYGINPAGKEAFSNGGGPILGDQGSAYYIGCEALKAVLCALDGRSEYTALAMAILVNTGLFGSIQEDWFGDKASIDHGKMECIITRNTKDFGSSPVRAVLPRRLSEKHIGLRP
jgi:N-acetylglucosamine kinase-like BadF-type ATPase